MPRYGYGYGYARAYVGGILAGGDNQIFDVDTIDLDGTSQYLELQGSTSRLNIGTQTLAINGWVYIDSTSIGVFSKYDSSATHLKGWFGYLNKSTLALIVRLGASSNWEASASSLNLSDGWHNFVIYYDRTSRTSPPIAYVDGSLVTMTITRDDSDPTNVDIINTLPYQIGGNRSNNAQYYFDAIYFTGIAIGTPLTQSDAVALYNNGIPQCFDDIDTAISSKFDAFFDNGTYDNRTETQALTGRVNGWELNNINNAPFVDQGLQVECSGSDELNNIESTAQACYQLSSIKASSTSDILVSSWTDVISGTYNLVQTNDDNKPLFTGDTVKFDGNNDFLSGLPLNEGDFTIVFKGLSFGEAGGTEVLLTKDDNATPTIRMFTNGLLTARTTDGTQINLINYSSFRSSVHNLGFIKRGNQLETWVDRVMLGSSTIPSGELLLNQIGRTSSSFNGEIKDSIFVFDRALSDVDALYIGGVTTLNGEDADGNSLADSQGNIIKIVEKE